LPGESVLVGIFRLSDFVQVPTNDIFLVADVCPQCSCLLACET